MLPFELFLVIIITVVIFVLFATEKFPVDVVALLIIVVLMLTGLITPEEAVSGFANTATITVLAMFIISDGIQRSGVVHLLGEKILQITKTYFHQLLAISGISTLGGLINNTPSVSILAPMVMDISRKTKTYATQLLIPLSFISMAAGTLTLIGSSSNILANNIYVRAGNAPLNLFEISKLGIFIFLIVVVYFLTIGKFLLPKRKGHTDITDPYTKMKYNADAILPPESSLIGNKIKQSKLKDYGIEVFSITRSGKIYRRDLEDYTIEADDVLAVYGSRLKILQADSEGLIKLESGVKHVETGESLVIDQFMVAEGSSLVHQTINSIGFTDRFNASVLALKRADKKIKTSIDTVQLKFTDILLVKAPPQTIDIMKLSNEFIYIGEVAGPHRLSKMKFAVGIFLLIILLAAFQIIPIMSAALLGVLLMALTRVVTLKEAYSAVNWQIIFLLAGVIPLGIALQKTGAVELITNYIVSFSEFTHPLVILGIFYFITSLLTQVISNNAAIILLAPIALVSAGELGLNPVPFLIVVMFAASTAYLTPIGYQTNTMVYQIGNYKFTDFTKVGLPLNIILLFATTLLAAWIWGL
ncbi:SLC13 family permease [Patescibacteria group bacterium]